uniref:Uncharacterized protein n=2 Tax=environmental samples TaxID=68359 RepID=A0A075GM85_9EURY|nr:hypothetical protein [uncultured marine group II/III euryarchaeote KM3_158_C07]AIF04225.1 hypothetical protein [uncultured marine group II/III euryarchaeote KM3_172_D07]
MPIDIKVTAGLNHNTPIPKRITGLILDAYLEYRVRKYNIIALVQLFCRVSSTGDLILNIIQYDFATIYGLARLSKKKGEQGERYT